MTKEIQLTQGKIAIVDGEDFELLNQWKWYYRKSAGKKTGYALRNQYMEGGIQKTIQMHRVILNCPDVSTQVDHINGDGIDNRKSNLRTCTANGNVQNQGLRKCNTTGYKGIIFRPDLKKWQAYITADRKRIHLGYHQDKKIAALAYNEAALKYHGEFARLNMIPQ